MIGAGIIEAYRLLHQPQAECARVDLEVALHASRNGGDVVDAVLSQGDYLPRGGPPAPEESGSGHVVDFESGRLFQLAAPGDGFGGCRARLYGLPCAQLLQVQLGLQPLQDGVVDEASAVHPQQLIPGGAVGL